MKIHSTVVSMVLGALLMVFCPADGRSQSCTATWTGNAGNGSWSTAGNWSPSKVPGSTSDVCIPTFTTANGAGLDGSSSIISVHSIQVSEGASLLFGSGKVSVSTSLINQGNVQMFGTTLSAASIDLPSPGEIDAFDNSSITCPSFSNAAGTVTVGAGGTLRLMDYPVQLQNGNLSGGSWLVSGVLIIPGNIAEITSQGTVLEIDAVGSAVEDASGGNSLATLASVGPGAVLAVFNSASLTVAQNLTSQGVVDADGSLTISGTYTQATGATTNMGGTLRASSVSVQAGSRLQGNGTVASSVINNGTVAPQGSLTVTGNYSQASAAALTEQFGSTLHVNANASLSGALNITVNPKHPPLSGATYTALTSGSLAGSFTRTTAGFTVTTSGNNILVKKQ